MEIRRTENGEAEVLLDIWSRSVRATHGFIPEADVQAMIPEVRDYLASTKTEFWVACDASGEVAGFMGMSGGKMESLFLSPDRMRRGIGRRLVEHARATYGELTVDVNEDNEDARQFYESCGFVVVGRSELDEQGRPHPLLHMRQVNAPS